MSIFNFIDTRMTFCLKYDQNWDKMTDNRTVSDASLTPVQRMISSCSGAILTSVFGKGKMLFIKLMSTRK